MGGGVRRHEAAHGLGARGGAVLTVGEEGFVKHGDGVQRAELGLRHGFERRELQQRLTANPSLFCFSFLRDALRNFLVGPVLAMLAGRMRKGGNCFLTHPLGSMKNGC